MSVVVVGVQHPQTPLDLLERVAVDEEALAKVLGKLRDESNLSEVVVLSTCLRTEVYAVVERFHEGVAHLQEFLASVAHVPVEALAEYVNVLFDDDVTVHLFEVAAGLRSAVLGETEVLGQVRRAAGRAASEKASGPVLSGLFSRAVRTGRRVRSTTTISRGSTSLSQVAVELVEARLSTSLAGSRALVVGAGEVAEGLLRALEASAFADVVVVNRTRSRAEHLAARTGARAAPFEALATELAQARVVFVSTGASEHVLDADLLSSARAKHGHFADPELLVVDLGMPRNVDPDIADQRGVSLFDIEDLNARAESTLSERRGEFDEASRIVKGEVERYRADERARGAAPVVSALRDKLEAILQAELARHRSRLAKLEGRDREELEAILRDVLAKLAHSPTVALKEASGTPRGERLVEALRTLFDL